MNRKFNRFHFRDTEIKTREDSIYINPTVKFIIVWAVFLILVLLFLVIVKPFSKNKHKNDNNGQTTEVAQNGVTETAANGGTVDTSTTEVIIADPVTASTDGSIIKRNEYPAVNSFCESYLNAITNCDYNMLSTMVVDPSLINPDDLTKRLIFATKYSNPECYTAPGLTEGTFVVYVVVNQQIPGVNVQPLSIHQFYLRPNAYGGYVHDNTISTDAQIMAYIDELNKNPEIVKVFDRVDKNNTDSVAQDETLRQFYDKLNSGSTDEVQDEVTEE